MDDPTEDRDPEGGEPAVQPGGRSSRGPNPSPGGEEEAGGMVPPYEQRTGDGSAENDERAASVERQMSDAKSGAHESTATPADEQPVSEDQVTDEVPESPKGVGESLSRRGEDVGDKDREEAGRERVGTHGESGRPAGTSDERDSTSVDPQRGQGG